MDTFQEFIQGLDIPGDGKGSTKTTHFSQRHSSYTQTSRCCLSPRPLTLDLSIHLRGVGFPVCHVFSIARPLAANRPCQGFFGSSKASERGIFSVQNFMVMT